MTKPPRSPRLLARLLLLIAFLLSTGVWLSQRGDSDDGLKARPERSAGQPTAAGQHPSPAADDSTPRSAGPTKRSDRGRPNEGGDRPNALGNPSAGDLTDPIRALARGVVPAGHSMVTGGHPLADGSHEFAVITPKWLESPNGSKQVEIEVELLDLDEAGLKSAGLETLVTAERTSEQNAEVWTPEEVSRTMEDVDPASFQAKPRVIVSPGSPARITVGSKDGGGFELELSATETADGGFELSSDLKRIE
jgi:hypothetical protein